MVRPVFGAAAGMQSFNSSSAAGSSPWTGTESLCSEIGADVVSPIDEIVSAGHLVVVVSRTVCVELTRYVGFAGYRPLHIHNSFSVTRVTRLEAALSRACPAEDHTLVYYSSMREQGTYDTGAESCIHTNCR